MTRRHASPVVGRRQLAQALRELREAAGLTLEEAAVAIEASAATLSRIETTVRTPRARDVRDLCQFYGVPPQQTAELLTLTATARETGWWEAYSEVDDEYATYIGLEAAATSIHEYEGQLLPALLQTAAYAREILTKTYSPIRRIPFIEHDIDKRIEVLTRRQALLDPDSGLAFSVVIDQAVLCRPVGDSELMREQLEHLAARAGQENIDLRIAPLDRGVYPGLAGSFSILTLPHDVSDVVYVETMGEQLFLESDEDLARHRQSFLAIQKTAWDPARTQNALTGPEALRWHERETKRPTG